MVSQYPIDSALIRCAVCGADQIRFWFHTDFGPIGRCGGWGQVMYVIYHALRRICPPIAQPFGRRLYNPFHTYYFTKRSLARLVTDSGFETIEHRGYEFPLSRLEASSALKFGMRGLYLFQGIAGMEGEQRLFARKRQAIG